MNTDSYFETDPWAYAVEAVQNSGLGSIVAFAIQMSCKAGEMEGALQQWQTQLDELFGKPMRRDELSCKQAVSLLLRYDGPVIGRIFIDENSDEAFCNFEIVGTDALLIWKPNVCALSTVRTAGRREIIYQHPYAVALRKQVLS